MKKNKKSEKEVIQYNSLQEQAFDWLDSEFGWSPEQIELNRGTFTGMLCSLFPGKVITVLRDAAPDAPILWDDDTMKLPKENRIATIYIDTTTGVVITPELAQEIPTAKSLKVSGRVFSDKDNYKDFNEFKSKYIYVYDMRHWSKEESEKYCYFNQRLLGIRMAEYNPGKKPVTFTIDEEVYNNFQMLSEKMAINKSKFVENKLKEFIAMNSSLTEQYYGVKP